MLDIAKLHRALDLEASIESASKALAPAKQELWSTMWDIANEAQQSGVDEYTVEEIGKVKPRFKRRVIIMGGADKESDERQAVLEILAANGHGDKIRTFRAMDKRAMDSAFEDLDPEQIQHMLEAKLIRVELVPEITIGRRKLGKDAEAES